MAALLAIGSSGCGLILAPICLARQDRRPVTTLTGDVAPGSVVVHRVKYGTAGSQNDLRLSWTGRGETGGPRLRVYLTRVDCEAFDPARGSRPYDGVCRSLGSIGSRVAPDARPCARDGTCAPQVGDLLQSSLSLTHGRGNPETLGPAAEYKVWIFGDVLQSASYSIDITSFYGPDC